MGEREEEEEDEWRDGVVAMPIFFSMLRAPTTPPQQLHAKAAVDGELRLDASAPRDSETPRGFGARELIEREK